MYINVRELIGIIWRNISTIQHAYLLFFLWRVREMFPTFFLILFCQFMYPFKTTHVSLMLQKMQFETAGLYNLFSISVVYSYSPSGLFCINFVSYFL